MKKLNKIIPIILSTILIFAPCYVNAITNETPVIEDESSVSNEPSNSEDESSVSNEPSNSEEESNTSSEPVEEPLDYNITLNKEELNLDSGKSETLKATTNPVDAEVMWSITAQSEGVSTTSTIDQNGKITAGNKAETVIVTATIKDTNVKASCTVKITRIIGKDATLRSLSISNGNLEPTFQSDIYKYDVSIDSNTTSLNFGNLLDKCEEENKGCQVIGNKNLKNGSTVKILVAAENHTEENPNQKTYELKIVKEETSLNLKKLEINGYALNEVFDPEVTEYTASIPYEIETISVSTTPEDNKATVKPSGLTNLKVGVNTVKITVTDENGNSKVYKIKVTRETEISVEENPTSIITSSGNESQTSSMTVPINENNHAENDNFIKYAVVSLACLILFAIGGIGIYFYLKTSPKKLKKELNNIKEEEMEIPIIEIENKKSEPSSSIVEVMQENLIETREFKKEDLQTNSKPEDLFDEEDV